jgi:membrane protein DedA with SNARE-associated domain
VVRIPWRRFAAFDLAALLAHLAAWSGLGWWLSDDLGRLQVSADVGKILGVWTMLGVIVSVLAIMVWRRRPVWQPATARVMRRAGRSLRQFSGGL